MEPIHHRMPALLADTAAWDAWLDQRRPVRVGRGSAAGRWVEHGRPRLATQGPHPGSQGRQDAPAPDALAPLLRPFSPDAMTAVAVGPRVSNVRHDDESCLVPAAPGEPSPNQLGFMF